jgi:AcrR family transcriptional regulator
MSRDARRRQVLDAAVPLVAEHGFAGVTTDQVARAAGVSQPYVVRMFGGKADLLAALFEATGERLLDAFRAVPAGPDAHEEMGRVYVHLVSDRDLLRVVLHGFAAGADPRLGAIGRRILAGVARLHRERTGGDADATQAFVAHGMLINTVLALGVPEHAGEDPDLADLAACLEDEAVRALPGATA